MKFPFILCLELVSLLLSCICYKGLNKFRLTSFIPLLFITCAVELLGLNKTYFGWKNNYFIYNYYLLVSYPLFLHIYLNMLAYKGRARLNYIATGFFILSLFLINYLFIQGSRVFNSYSLIVTNISYTILSSLVLLRLLKTDDWDIPLQKHPYFWIGGSLIIYSLTMVVILGLQPFILSNKIQIDGKSIYMILSPTVNVILYTCFSYSFFLCQKLTNK